MTNEIQAATNLLPTTVETSGLINSLIMILLGAVGAKYRFALLLLQRILGLRSSSETEKVITELKNRIATLEAKNGQ